MSDELEHLAAHRPTSRLGQSRIIVADHDAVVIANDKWLTSTHLAGADIDVPWSALPSQLHAGADVAARIGTPYLTKPRIGRGGRGVAVHRDAHALAGLDDTVVVQEFIPGAEYAANLYIAADASDDVVVVLEKTALAGGIVGNALGVRRVAEHDVAALAREAARSLGLRGPVDVDARRRADGTPVVLEINARFGATSVHAPELVDALLAEHASIALAAR